MIPFIFLLAAQLFSHGYDIIADKSVAAVIMTFDTVDEERFGFKIPGCAQISKVNETRECQMKFESAESYIESRLKNLGFNFSILPILAMAITSIMEPKLEVHLRSKNVSSGTSTETTESSLTEYRMAKISIKCFKSHGVKFTNDFLSAVEELPARYAKDDDTQTNSNKRKFKQFLKKFGQFVVTSAFVGGSVELTRRSESSERLKQDETSRGGSAGMKIPKVVEFEVSGESKSSSNSTKNATMNIEKTIWHGGRSDLHSKSTLMSEEQLQMWKASLAKDPIILTTEMSLQPISNVVAIINEEKGEACYKALCDTFGIEDFGDLDELQEKRRASQAKQLEEEKSRLDSNSRAGSTKQPSFIDLSDLLLLSPLNLTQAIARKICFLACV